MSEQQKISTVLLGIPGALLVAALGVLLIWGVFF